MTETEKKEDTEFEEKFLNCAVDPHGMECWKCTPEQEKYCEKAIATRVAGDQS